MVTNALLASLLVWIGAHTAYDVSHVSVPRIEFHTQKELNNLFYGDMPCKGRKELNVVAVYSTEDGGVEYLNKKFNVHNPEDQSVLLHETFHHVQHSNGGWWMPKGSRWVELEAIAVENMWRKEHGLKELDRPIAADSCK